MTSLIIASYHWVFYTLIYIHNLKKKLLITINTLSLISEKFYTTQIRNMYLDSNTSALNRKLYERLSMYFNNNFHGKSDNAYN